MENEIVIALRFGFIRVCACIWNDTQMMDDKPEM